MCLATFEAVGTLVGAVGAQTHGLTACNQLDEALRVAAVRGPAALSRSPVLCSVLSQLLLLIVQVGACFAWPARANVAARPVQQLTAGSCDCCML